MSFDFEAAVSAPFRMQPGLRRLAPGTRQLTPLGAGSRHQREKLAVLSAFAHQALLRQPGFDAAPALDALCRQAAAEHPEAFTWNGRRATALGTAVEDGEVHALAAGSFGLGDEVARCLRALPAEWRLASLLALAFAEDFAIVDGSDATIPWVAVALPSHWAPEDKVGRHFAEVHAPVADNALLVNASAALTRMVTAPGAWERFVWNITSHPRLHAHPRRFEERRWELTPVPQAWFRTEHQTFIPLPERRQAIFTIRVDVQPLHSVLTTPERRTRLHDAVATMSPAVLAYRGLAGVRDELLAWLAAPR